MQPKLIIHGGAWDIPEQLEADHLNGIRKALEQVYSQLKSGLSALDAVEAAVKILEADPTFDAGRGAFLNALGEIELDAMIMDGRDLNFGAVAAVQNILHPVSLARMVMEKTEHNFIVGKGAQLLANELGFEEVEPRVLLTKREWEFYERIKKDASFTTRKPFEKLHDTVGAVALDSRGNLAAATSTGGTPRKLPGRVGDSPVIGAGAYAENGLGAASATGFGESIMKVLLCKTACDLLAKQSAVQAAKQAIRILEEKVNGLGGIILIDAQGEYGFHFNTPKMAWGYVDGNEKLVVRIR